MSQSNIVAGEPRCSYCGQPLSSWAEPHSIEDCAAWMRMAPTDRRHVEEDVAAERAGR